jgi:hypothetical protein
MTGRPVGIRDTAREGKTALFDSWTGEAIGEVFDSTDDADDFLEWVEAAYRDGAQVLRLRSVASQLRDEWERIRGG